MDTLIVVAVSAFFIWAALLPIAAVVTGLTGHWRFLVTLAGLELALLIGVLLLPVLAGAGWETYDRAPKLALQSFLMSVTMAVVVHALLAWIRQRRS